jgi:outer membrane protein assembly factor BamE
MPMPRVLLLLLALQLSACGWLAPYRIDIQQGNFVSQEMVAQLKRGMTKEQVRFVLGTPLVTDIFHANRWDFVYFLDRPGQPRVQRRLAVYFEDDRLARVEGDVVAAAAGAEPAQ